MSNEQWTNLFVQAQQWVKEAGRLIKQSFSDPLTVDYKTNPSDLVTNVDKQIERFFIHNIKRTFPSHRILGEEGFGDSIQSTAGILWIIDPIDGTTNFVHQQRHFAISVAVFEDGVGKVALIYDVVSEELYHCIKGQGAYINETKLPSLEKKEISKAIMALNATWITKNRRIDPAVLAPLVTATRGTRSYGSAAIEMAYVAAGFIDIYISLRLSPWDFAAGLLLVEEVGGKTTRLDGEPLHLLEQNTVFVANPYIYDDILHTYILPRLE